MTLLAMRNAIAILMASLGVAILGFVALGRLPVDLFPNINLPIINVGTIYTGAGVLDVEKTVTYPIEKAISVSDVRFVEYINELRRRGLPLLEAVPQAGRVRLRPILMTVLATVVGLLPMAFAFGVGTEANQPLAITVIGGLLVSTFLTLVLIPVLYVIFETWFPRTLPVDEDVAAPLGGSTAAGRGRGSIPPAS
jgi:multidrug efflux pump subunit AcrB